VATGLLFSQIGYDAGTRPCVMVRADRRTALADDARVELLGAGGATVSAPLAYWGEKWGQSWWRAEFPEVPPGSYRVVVAGSNAGELSADGLRVAKRALWDTWRFASYDMLERRRKIAQAPHGWQNAGTLWQEANAHAAMVVGMLDLVEFASAHLDAGGRRRLVAQIVEGARYLALCQDRASARGAPDGSVSHDVIGHEDVILPADAAKAAIVWARASRLLDGAECPERADFLERARRAFDWLDKTARPLVDVPFLSLPHGAPEGYRHPPCWRTQDLIEQLWAAFELSRSGCDRRDACRRLAREIAARQVLPDEAAREDGLHGHFWTFPDRLFSMKSWTHHLENRQFGGDVGGTFPMYVVPLLRMAQAWPEDPDAPAWRETVERFARGFLLSACERNPFLIMPQGVYGAEGLLWFAGTWHGMNAIYGLAAGMALELARFTGERRFRDVAAGNLQWIAGLNAGATRESVETGCVMTCLDVPEGVALPVSMVCDIGARWAGTWFRTRGVIADCFSVGEQFRFDVFPTRASDAPSSFTDEEWLTQNGGWLSGLAQWIRTMEEEQ